MPPRAPRPPARERTPAHERTPARERVERAPARERSARERTPAHAPAHERVERAPARERRSARERTPARERVERVYGLAAARAVFARRPEQVVNVAYTPQAQKALGELLREAARRRIAYREVSDAELSRMAESLHHEGVCLLVKPLPALGPRELAQSVGQRGLVLALDDVENPHNVGAILRSAAYFGVAALLLADAERSPLTAAARRVAEGGAELVPIAHVPALPAALRSLAEQGLVAVGADARAKLSLSELRWPERAVVVLGNEQHGLSAETRKACKLLVRIAGAEAIDSLNVSVAAGVFMASYANMHGSPT